MIYCPYVLLVIVIGIKCIVAHACCCGIAFSFLQFLSFFSLFWYLSLCFDLHVALFLINLLILFSIEYSLKYPCPEVTPSAVYVMI